MRNDMPLDVIAEHQRVKLLAAAGLVQWRILNPRIRANGAACCTDPAHLCDDCRAHSTGSRSASSYAPPNPYESGVANLRAANVARDAAAIATDQAAGLAALRKENNR
jgi:hypothetical protein